MRKFLVVLFFMFLSPLIFSQADNHLGEEGETPNSLELRVETFPANPAAGSSWSIYILINHPSPSEVNIEPPGFPPFLVLERVRMESRFIQNERWTRAEFLFTPQRSGTVTLQPFKVAVSGRRGTTGYMNVSFRELTPAAREPRFRWLGTPSPVRLGERGELILELSGWDPLKEAPRSLFQGKVPRNAILDENPPKMAGEGVYRYTFVIIPLEGSSIVLDPLSFRSNTYTLNIPEISVPVLPVRVRTAEIPVIQMEDEKEEISSSSFLVDQERVFPFFRGGYRRITARAMNLWDEGRRAEALAELRQNERDNFSGPFLVPLRREMELALGLGFTEDEKWQPFGISLLSWVICGILILSAVVLLLVFRQGTQKKGVTFRRLKGYKLVIPLVFSIVFLFVFLQNGMGYFLKSRSSSPGNAVILEKAPAHRVPDIKGAVNAWFDDGQPVVVGDFLGDWCYAESPDGRSGWVFREAVIIY